ncbi:MAG TPA: phosphoribosylformylglycinamidine synthase subunit PurQ, partial [Acidobacteriota bacterium]|nr:phosphoribosylformylglycinamidine synthase subunit PurQ [Acidobacteriota bacterium]
MKFGIVVFPGSNCDHDAYHSAKHVLGEEACFLWHEDTNLQGVDTVILPGGFSYGDYLRCGAIARFSPITDAIRRHAEKGGLVMGICNGFQILQEMGLLPGIMLPNSGLKFVCRHVYLRTETEETPFSNQCRKGQILKIPVAHQDGNFFAP